MSAIKPAINRPPHNKRSSTSKPCKCLSCSIPEVEEYEDLKIMVCGDGACFTNCEFCVDRPRWCGLFTPKIDMAM